MASVLIPALSEPGYKVSPRCTVSLVAKLLHQFDSLPLAISCSSAEFVTPSAAYEGYAVSHLMGIRRLNNKQKMLNIHQKGILIFNANAIIGLTYSMNPCTQLKQLN